MSEPYKGWTVLELLGHRRLHGLVQETTLAGAGMLRIDVYEGPAETPALTRLQSSPASQLQQPVGKPAPHLERRVWLSRLVAQLQTFKTSGNLEDLK